MIIYHVCFIPKDCIYYLLNGRFFGKFFFKHDLNNYEINQVSKFEWF